MSEAPDHKPRPARLPEVERPAGSAMPSPAREVVESRGVEAGASESSRTAAGAPEPDVGEVLVEVGGVTWRVGVLGRSGGVGSRSPPLLMLGFRRAGDAGEERVRESTVVARALRELTEPRLQEAFSRSTPPPREDRRKPFFETATANRRSGGAARRED